MKVLLNLPDVASTTPSPHAHKSLHYYYYYYYCNRAWLHEAAGTYESFNATWLLIPSVFNMHHESKLNLDFPGSCRSFGSLPVSDSQVLLSVPFVIKLEYLRSHWSCGGCQLEGLREDVGKTAGNEVVKRVIFFFFSLSVWQPQISSW